MIFGAFMGDEAGEDEDAAGRTLVEETADRTGLPVI
jgi:hypothetical protein